jgi:hypothetical protein
MSRLLEFILGSILMTVFTVAFLFFSAVHYILSAGSIADCTWQGSAQAWIDSDADGRIDPGEPPLSDVRVHVDHDQNQLLDISWPAITGRDGEVQFNLSIPGCSNTLFEIYVDIPEGYRVTTKPRIEVNPDIWQGLNTKPVYYFGFKSDT